MVGSLTTTFSAFSDHSTKLNLAAAQTVDAMEQMFHRLQQVEAAPDMISSKLNPMIDVVKKVLMAAEKRSAAHEETFSQLAARATIFASAAEALQSSVETSRTAWSSQADQLARILPAAEADAAKLRTTVNEILAGFSSEIAPIRQVVAQLAKVVQEDAAVIARHRTELQKDLQASRSAVLETQRSLTSMAELVVEKLDGR
jgi:chromosome segregation ATPase